VNVHDIDEKRRRWSRDEIETTLREQLPYWLPHGGEAGDTPGERAKVAAAAKIIADRLPGATAPRDAAASSRKQQR
jgi:hypothetical protein